MQLKQLSPHQLVDNDRNVRLEIDNIDDILASAPHVGIVQPLVVSPIDAATEDTSDAASDVRLGTDENGQRFHDYFLIHMGHRRKRAAIELDMDTVPCVVVDPNDRAIEILGQLAENDDRHNLKPSERANAYAQLALLEWTPEQIAQARGKSVKHVEQSLVLDRMPEEVKRAADFDQLTLDAAQRLEEFEDDPKILAKILDRSTAWGVEHVIEDEKRKRNMKEKTEALKAELRAAGVKVIPRPKEFGYSSQVESVQNLADADGKALDPEEVKTKPGFAVIIDNSSYAGEPRYTVVCTDPEGWGYKRTGYNRYVSPAEQARREQEQRDKEQRRAELDAAAAVRVKFLKSTYGSAKAAKELVTEALRAAVIRPSSIGVSGSDEALVRSLAGAKLELAAKAGPDRLNRLLVARWVVANEGNIQDVVQQRGYRADMPRALAWFDRLVADGYELSEAEAMLHADMTALVAHLEQQRAAEEEAAAAAGGWDLDQDDSDTDERDDDADDEDADESAGEASSDAGSLDDSDDSDDSDDGAEDTGAAEDSDVEASPQPVAA